MCRIAGIWYPEDHHRKIDTAILGRMRDVMCYGGPDAAGVFIDQENNLGLGHRRLSIIDLTEAANQPVHFENLHLIFNGELYNYKEIKDKLVSLQHVFKTNSDTEVILHAWKQWGVDCLQQFRGMFAFAIWDEKDEELILVRDRVGVKPLYWYQHDGLFMFASELKAFHEHPDFDKSINHAAIPGFLKTGYIKSPESIYKYAYKLEPGSVLKVFKKGPIKKIRYWDVKQIYSNAVPRKEDDTFLINECETILRESFNLRMVSDVPVGIFLSGGIDSSLVTALLQSGSERPLKTFTIGFHETEYNEATHAKNIARHLGTEHYELYCSENEFLEVLDNYFDIYDEPFGDNSGIPTFLVSRLAKQHVKVSLSADGGDEIFAGYNRYSANHHFYERIRKVPASFRKLASSILTEIGHDRAVKLFKRLPVTSKISNLEWRMSKILNAINARNAIEFQDLISSYISGKTLNELVAVENNHNGTEAPWTAKKDLMYSLLGAMDITTYLEGDILAKVDRATMQNSLEGREPFLDQHIIEFALNLPDDIKIRNGETKWILRQILSKHIPRAMWERPKQGFAVPTKKWLNSLLYDELDNIYQDTRFVECFRFNAIPLKNIILSFKNNAGKQENPYLVWFLYCLYGWYKRWC